MDLRSLVGRSLRFWLPCRSRFSLPFSLSPLTLPDPSASRAVARTTTEEGSLDAVSAPFLSGKRYGMRVPGEPDASSASRLGLAVLDR